VHFVGREKVTLSVLALALYCIHSLAGHAQKLPNESVNDILSRGGKVAGNIEMAITEHITEDASFRRVKQLPEDKRDLPNPLVKRDGSFEFDWTLGQHARYLMEALRQGIHALQSVEKPRGMDVIALAGSREYWPKLRDISCNENPGIRYYDLDGFEQYCPTK